MKIQSKLIILSLIFAFSLKLKVEAADSTNTLKSTKPDPIDVKDFTFPEYSTKFLKNGIKVFIIEDKEQPTIEIKMNIRGGSLLDKKGGEAFFTSKMLLKGTKKQKSEEFTQGLEGYGLDINTNSSHDKVTITAKGLAKFTDRLLENLSEMLVSPRMDEDELDKLKNIEKGSIRTSKGNPNALSSRMTDFALYGADHPFSQFLTDNKVKNIKIDDITEYFSKYIKPNQTIMTIVGDFKTDDIFNKLEKYFDKWEVVENVAYPVPQAKRNPTGIYFVNRPGSQQSVIRYVCPTTSYNDDDYMAIELASDYMGSGFSGRLMKTLRETYSYTYSPRTMQTTNSDLNYFTATASVRNSVTDSSISVILDEFNKLASNPVLVEDLDLTKKLISGNYQMKFEDPGFIGDLLLKYDFNYKPLSNIKSFANQLERISNIDVQKVAKRYLNPQNAYIIVVGNPDIKKNLTKFGKIYEYDLNLEPIKLDDAKITLEELIEKYKNALGNKDSIANIKSIRTMGSFESSANGTQVNGIYEEVKKAPNKYYQSSDFGFQKNIRIYNGTQAWGGSDNNLIQYDGVNLERIKFDANILKETKFLDGQWECTIIGKKDGLIQLKAKYKPTSSNFIFYFDESTFLLQKYEAISNINGAISIDDYIILEYGTFAGVKLPKKVLTKSTYYEMKLDLNYQINDTVDDSYFEKK